MENKLKLWESLSETSSLIPLEGKAPIERDWTQYCTEKREFKPEDFRGHNAGICTGLASNLLVLDIDNPDLFFETCREKGWDFDKKA